MKIRDIMTRDVVLTAPDKPLSSVASEMQRCDIGAMPVAAGGRLVGMITDRDIAVRAVANGLSSQAPVRAAMSREVKYCFEDDDVQSLAYNMADQQLRRLPVLDSRKRLVGIVSLGDIAVSESSAAPSVALSGISQSGGAHNQSNEQSNGLQDRR